MVKTEYSVFCKRTLHIDVLNSEQLEADGSEPDVNMRCCSSKLDLSVPAWSVILCDFQMSTPWPLFE